MTPWRATSWLRRRAGDETARTRRTRLAVRAVEAAWARRDVDALARLLTRDATLLVDGGGIVPVSVRQATGDIPVAAAMVAVLSTFPDVTIAQAEVNGMPGLTVRTEGRVLGVVGFSVRGRAIAHVWAVVNPAKLAHWNR